MATVKMHTGKDSIVVIANAEGRYRFSKVLVNQFMLTASSVGYQTTKQSFKVATGNTNAELEPIILQGDTILLKGITVSSGNAVKMKGDTLEYKAAAYQVRLGSVVEDALKRMPGLEVGRDGSISFQGKQIARVRLNGKDYMAGDVKSLTRILPADLVQNIQIIEDYGEQAKLTGVKTAEPQKVLNINIRKDKN